MPTTLPWFSSFPLYLAPMAGGSDKIFRQFCKERGAHVLVTEFLSAQGVLRPTERVRAVAPLPVTAKIRIGWDADSINAPRVAKILEETGIQAVAVHGRTRAQGYSGEADWKVIGEVVSAVAIPVIGNGDLTSGADVIRRRAETEIAGAMIGRAAMSAPWIFNQVKHYFATGEHLPSPSLDERWELIRPHCQLAVEEWGREDQAMRSMRARLMAYSKGFPNSKMLREKFQHVSTLTEIAEIASRHMTPQAAAV